MNIRVVAPILFFLILSAVFFRGFFLFGKLPIPSDALIGLYHPFRDYLAEEYPRGVPYKNFLITDPVLQQYPFRSLATDEIRAGGRAEWNPYVMAGFPLAANIQSAPFYPLNIFLFILPFSLGWSVLVFLQPVLGAIFLYYYLRNLHLELFPSFLGSTAFVLSGFSVAWLEWNTIGHVALWLPLLLLAVDKTVSLKHAPLTEKKFLSWTVIFILGLSSSFFAGHLQTFFYLLIFLIVYIFVRWYRSGRGIKLPGVFALLFLVSFIITAVQWMPSVQLMLRSARNLDQAAWMREGWFIPWEHLVQFIVPDFFGNPTTLNYWGTWNYGELVGYVGLLPLLIAVFALFYRHDRKTLFFGISFFVSLGLSLPTVLSEIPFRMQIPFFASAQPTRLLFITDFSLAVLSALGLSHFLKTKKGIIPVMLFFLILFILAWLFVLFGRQVEPLPIENISVTQRNLIYSSLLFSITCFLLISGRFVQKKYARIVIIALLVITCIDLLRFAEKFTPFTDRAYLYPSTKAIDFLQKNIGHHRIMSTDDRILPPNASVMYRLQTVDGYDPLYLKEYGELIAASERGQPNISGPLGFNRIITPQRYDSPIMDLLGVKYILSLNDLESVHLQKVFQEGETRVYENRNVFPRAFFVTKVASATSDQEAIDTMFREDLTKVAVVQPPSGSGNLMLEDEDGGSAEILQYSENKITIRTKNDEAGFLVLTDSYYPGWSASVTDNPDTGVSTNLAIHRTNYALRGVMIPAGENIVEFVYSFQIFD